MYKNLDLEKQILNKINYHLEFDIKFADFYAINNAGHSLLTMIALNNKTNKMKLTPEETIYLIYNSDLNYVNPYWGLKSLMILQCAKGFYMKFDEKTLDYLLKNTDLLATGNENSFFDLLLDNGNHLGFTENQINYIIDSHFLITPPDNRLLNTIYLIAKRYLSNDNFLSPSQIIFLLDRNKTIAKNKNSCYTLDPHLLDKNLELFKSINLFLEIFSVNVNINNSLPSTKKQPPSNFIKL